MSWYWLKAVENYQLTLSKSMTARECPQLSRSMPTPGNFIPQILLEAEISLHLQEQYLANQSFF